MDGQEESEPKVTFQVGDRPWGQYVLVSPGQITAKFRVFPPHKVTFLVNDKHYE